MPFCQNVLTVLDSELMSTRFYKYTVNCFGVPKVNTWLHVYCKASKNRDTILVLTMEQYVFTARQCIQKTHMEWQTM